MSEERQKADRKSRDDRLKEALRANLKRRKAQAKQKKKTTDADRSKED